MVDEKLLELLAELRSHSKETEWLEFKSNHADNDIIGKDISALANGASLHGKNHGYLVFGIENESHKIIGTTYKPKSDKVGAEEVERWFLQHLDPRIDFRIYEFEAEGKHIALFEIPAASGRPVIFKNLKYIRVGSNTCKLNDYPDKEKKIWKIIPSEAFENEIALTNISSEKVPHYLDFPSFIKLTSQRSPVEHHVIMEQLLREGFICKDGENFSITNIGAILFAVDLKDFKNLERKGIRVVAYKGNDRINRQSDISGQKGYAVGFEGLFDHVITRLPSNIEIKKVASETVCVYPEIALRELFANALIHQDFRVNGVSPLIEIFDNRIEVSNAGSPIIQPIHFIDEKRSRNERIALFMRKIKLCEELGSGFDKVITSAEIYQLPAPLVEEYGDTTKVTLFAPQELRNMRKEDKIRACFQHCVLKFVIHERMTNETLRNRFKIASHNYPIASKIIDNTIEAGFIKPDSNSSGKRYAQYVPFWA